MNSSNISNFLQAVSASDTEALRARLSGEVIVPGDAEYDDARRVPNLTHYNRPAAIVRAQTSNDIAEAIKFARERGLRLAVRSGGHSVAGHSVIDGGVVVDMSALKGVNIDPDRRVARVQPGATSGDLAGPAHAYGLALSTGDTSTVGLGGLTLGGGIGFMARKHGLAIDNLLSVEIVTAEGEVIRASDKAHQDLFWALRGGGGNFGVVTEYEFKLAQVGSVYGGALVLPATRENLRAYIDYASTAPDELTTITNIMHAPPAPFIPEHRIGELVMMVLVTYTGDMAEGERVVQPLRDIAEPVGDAVGPIPYPVMYEFTAAAAEPHFAHVRSMFSDGITDEALDAILASMERATSPLCMAQLRPLGGAYGRVPAEATAFSHREKSIFFAALGLWMDPSDDRKTHQAWTEELWDSVRDERSGVYVNFLDEEGRGRVAEAYPADTYARLAFVKSVYDPENVFTANHNVRPVARRAQERAA